MNDINELNQLSKMLAWILSNNYDFLDPALIRPGRLDRKIILNLPDWYDRLEIINYYIIKLINY